MALSLHRDGKSIMQYYTILETVFYIFKGPNGKAYNSELCIITSAICCSIDYVMYTVIQIL